VKTLRVVELPAPAGSATILCMHGYGADARDLVPIAMELELARPARWIFPDAPLELPFGGRAWFPIDESRSLPIDGIAGRPEGLDEAVTAAEGLLASLKPGRVILGGFSQGAMMALELAARAAEPPLGLFLLSGTLVDEKNLARLAPRLKGLKYFQSHGSADPILSFRAAERLHAALEAAGLEGEFLRFEGPHSVPPEAAAGLGRYLNAALAAGAPR
jgi:phospholipase/carboxylesterase